MGMIEVADNLVIEIHDGETPSLRIHNDDGDGIVVVWPSQIQDLRDALAEAAGVAYVLAMLGRAGGGGSDGGEGFWTHPDPL